jgi:hypothetical protein
MGKFSKIITLNLFSLKFRKNLLNYLKKDNFRI